MNRRAGLRLALVVSLLGLPALTQEQSGKAASVVAPPTGALKALIVHPPQIALDGPRAEQRIGVVGEYADGRRFDLSRRHDVEPTRDVGEVRTLTEDIGRVIAKHPHMSIRRQVVGSVLVQDRSDSGGRPLVLDRRDDQGRESIRTGEDSRRDVVLQDLTTEVLLGTGQLW